MPFSRTEPNVPAYTEDPNSPFEATQQPSVTVTLANPSNHVLVLSDPQKVGHNQLQVNGDTGTNYDILRGDDSITTNLDSLNIIRGEHRASLVLRGLPGAVHMSQTAADIETGEAVAGRNPNISGPVNQFTLFRDSSVPADLRLRVFALDI